MKRSLEILAFAFTLATALPVVAASSLEQIAEFPAKEANQGVGVDAQHFYAAHSNYPEWPMTSSVEIFDADTMAHVGSHSFGIQFGSLTWVDWHDGHWWMTFANYDRPLGPGKTPYGHKANTVMVKMTKNFRPVQMWTLPKAILDKFEDMSNSGGSWGPDGYLYLTGHDPAELYRMRLPKAGSILELVDVIPMNIRGQGIAWDRGQPGVIYGVIRATKKEIEAGGSHKVTVFRLVEKP